jgi:hypothetical protein
VRFPNNPEKIPNRVRKREGDSVLEVVKDLREELDRMRRNQEYMQGGINQQDRSVRDLITVGANSTETIVVEAAENEFLYVTQAAIFPNTDEVEISLDEDSTNSNVDFRQDPKKVKNKVELEITNPNPDPKDYNYLVDAKGVEVRQ